MTFGSSVLAIAANGASQVTVTGAGPSDPGKRKALRQTGWAPNSIKLGDRYYRVDPLGFLISLGANFDEMVKAMGEDKAGEAALTALMSFALTMKDKSYVSGLADLSMALIDHERYRPRFIARFAESFSPMSSFMRQHNNVTDPTLKDARELNEKIGQNLPPAIQHAIEFVMPDVLTSTDRERLQPRVHLFGDPIQRDQIGIRVAQGVNYNSIRIDTGLVQRLMQACSDTSYRYQSRLCPRAFY